MKRILTFVGAAILGCGRSPSPAARRTTAVPSDSATAETVAAVRSNTADLAAIERLHQHDVAATLSQDPRALAELWTDDAVRMVPGGRAEVGRQTIYTNDSTQHERAPRARVIRYAPTIMDVQVVQDWAIEWGHFDGAYKRSPGDSLHVIRGSLLRVLRRQPDGSWRFVRVMWNSAE